MTARPHASELAHVTAEAERQRLVLQHVPLMRHIAGRIGTPPGVDREDLYGYGMVGLLAAADSFDPSRGLCFSTYAYPRVRGAILDELRRADLLSRGRRERVRETERAVHDLEQRLGRAPAPEDIAAELGVSIDEVDQALLEAKVQAGPSLDDAAAEGGSLAQLLADPRSQDPVGSAQWNETKQRLIAAIAELDEAERTVITLYYAEDLLLREIGAVLGVSESRVSQIHTRALYRLNTALAEDAGAGGGR